MAETTLVRRCCRSRWTPFAPWGASTILRQPISQIYASPGGGAKAENLKHICRALEITPKTKKWNLAAIEVVLKQKRFRQYDTFRPTSQNMTLSYDRFYESIRLRELPQFPGEYEYVSYSIRQLVAELIKFTHDPAH